MTKADDMAEYYKEAEAKAWKEFIQGDPVHRDIRRAYFVSKSKGWRNGKKRLRKHWKEVELISYCRGPFISAHRFPYDEYASECLGDGIPSGDVEAIFREQIEKL